MLRDRPSIFRRWFLLVVLASACRPEFTSPQNNHDLYGLVMTTTVSRSEIDPGDSVFVRVVLANPSAGSVTLHNYIISCPLSVEVRTRGSVNYYRGIPLCAGPGATSPIPVPVELAPGDSIVGSGWWPGVAYVSNVPGGLAQAVPAPSGTYHVVGLVWWDLPNISVGDSARVVVRAAQAATQLQR
jgi:hypothetical protein